MYRLLVCTVVLTAFFFSYCSSTRNASVGKPAPVTYAGEVKPILELRCSPCHYPPNGKAKHFASIDSVRSSIDDILRRTQLPKDHEDFMPFKMKKPPLSDTMINVLKRWKETGLME